MEFYENRARQPFIGFAQLWRGLRRWWLRRIARQALRRMSDQQLRDIGLDRKDVK
ncbi:DUF1127 domain-containing protein [Salmonella enterica]|uniref:DUF1127 domain-containing protein n=4 Tax=Salmonella houtenae TaxID=59205 RepID=A0A702LCX3_SALHO|nr:DUF1127 domain-containing protein [Salmonella enterica subsp. houtenae]EAA7388065.1 DUF1127 domain-containing protein [Salmonella enterica subsp. enterica]EAB2653585.1 DUF1127 domain-containing protein [Salmonella enterica]ECG1390578.1 DUF1127 domain-containing protein [Salmonella enterica subsp. houtenae str. CFSAN000557]ECT3980261.1 DUF1127 domain-containing protein [Salmonella enterica subsp. houtenae serovar 53:z4,z23:-]EEH1857420.1 DUF1127 domain-containing protein [Salmonella enterica